LIRTTIHFILIFILLASQAFGQLHPAVKKGAVSKWVVPQEFLDTLTPSENDIGDHHYLLYDRQVNVGLEENYVHMVIQLLNESGVQDMSSINVSIDPKYQKLTFHEINIYRDGEKVDKLGTHLIQSFQRETNLDRYIYDGSITAFVNLEDVRTGDILEYSYTRKGRNPIYGNLIDYYFDFEFETPVQDIYAKLVVPKSEKVFMKENKEAYKNVEKTIIGNNKVYKWSYSNVKPVFREGNVPDWFELYGGVQITNSSSWSDIAKWGVGLFKIDDRDREKVQRLVKSMKSGNEEEDALALIHFVQNEIRYFGLEEGLSGYKPHAPSQVIEQRYGDCKDKSLLLASALKEIGLEAYPMLVHSSNGLAIGDYLPSPSCFNHCVVALKFNGDDYYIDPTYSSQKGSLSDYYFPTYHYGLILTELTDSLTILPDSYAGFTQVEETFISYGLEEPVVFTVRTEYLGRRADYIRDFLKGTTVSKLSKDYLEYYATMYPSIKLTDNAFWIDSSDGGQNKIVVNEFYEVPEMWNVEDDDSNVTSLETYPIILRDAISLVKTPDRKMPYFISYPNKLIHTTRIKFHEEWSVSPSNNQIEEPGIRYNKTLDYNKKTFEVTIRELYESTRHFINAEDYKKYRSSVETILNETGFYATLTKNEEFAKGTGNLNDILMIVLSVVIGIYSLLVLYKYFSN
tara:strand:- start:2361 stop:4415 length:2055 start_codon:yes stop_codon:yes gene_type:complete